jgi:Sulfatase
MRVRAAILAVMLTAACAPARPAVTGGTATAPLNLLLVTLDTFRADRLTPRLTPALERLAAGGLRFTEARTVAPLTLPAHVSIMTGLRPPRHGTRLNGAVPASGADTLATRLQRAGYRTGAVVGAFVLDRRFGLAAGFDDYDDDIARDPAAMDTLHAERPAAAVIDGRRIARDVVVVVIEARRRRDRSRARDARAAHRSGAVAPVGAPLRRARALHAGTRRAEPRRRRGL